MVVLVPEFEAQKSCLWLDEAAVYSAASNAQPGLERTVPIFAAAAEASDFGKTIGSVVVEAEMEESRMQH